MDLKTTYPLMSLHLEGWVQLWAPWYKREMEVCQKSIVKVIKGHGTPDIQEETQDCLAWRAGARVKTQW